jgi:hypothetical protein
MLLSQALACFSRNSLRPDFNAHEYESGFSLAWLRNWSARVIRRDQGERQFFWCSSVAHVKPQKTIGARPVFSGVFNESRLAA